MGLLYSWRLSLSSEVSSVGAVLLPYACDHPSRLPGLAAHLLHCSLARWRQEVHARAMMEGVQLNRATYGYPLR